MNLIKLIIIWLFVVIFSLSAIANDKQEKLNFSPLFVPLSDAMGAIKNNNTEQAKSDLLVIETQLAQITQDQNRQTALLDELNIALDSAKHMPTDDTLKELSIKLYAYEKEQNPTDYSEKRRQFAKNIQKPLVVLEQAIVQFEKDNNIETVKLAYDRFNKTWVANERVVRNTSMAHYGKIETAMAMIRVGMENTPPNIAMMTDNLTILKTTIENYNKGDKLTEVQNNLKIDLAYGIDLLQKGLNAFEKNDKATAQIHLGEFIQIWASIEGDVRTRNANLYANIESQMPVIMAKGDKENIAQLSALIADLKTINPAANYTALDSMLILLREGLEALLIVLALITALNASGQTRGKKWVYGGVGLGLVGSVVGAVVLYRLFPQITSGANREALEGVVGMVAVVMMLVVGAWLHSKSSVRAWNHYIQNQLGKAMGAGSFISLFFLAFLSVFREGAETILFYVGILPSIAMSDFLLGIGLALGVLAVVAVVLFKTSLKLPMPMLFKILTLTIYMLGFKILGVSVSALQLTNHLPRTVLEFSAMPLLGIYPSVQGVAVQVLYVVVVVVMIRWGGGKQAN